MYVNCQGALAIKIWPGIFILKNCEVHQNQKNGTKQPNGYILSAYSILAKNNADELFEYTIHSMDYNGGFLRSRYCYWEKTLSNFECGDDLKTILVTLRMPFDFCNSTQTSHLNKCLCTLKIQ